MCLYASHSCRSVHPSAKNDENRSLSCYRTLIFTARLSAAADSSLVADQSVLVHVWWCGISRLSLARTVIYKSNQSNQNHPSLEATTVCSVCRHRGIGRYSEEISHVVEWTRVHSIKIREHEELGYLLSTQK